MKIGKNDPCPCRSGKKYKKCHYGKFFTHQAEKYVFSVKKGGKSYKVFQLFFHYSKKQNKSAIFLSFPYHKNSKGLLSHVIFPKNKRQVAKLSLKIGAKVTSHKVKYTHWQDGGVHFSQDKKIYTLKKDPSDSLEGSIGHLFTIQLKGVKDFEIKRDEKKYSLKQTDLDFDLKDEPDDSIKFTGWWYDSSNVKTTSDKYSRVYILTQGEGVKNQCFVLQPPSDSPLANKLLFLCARKEFMTKEKGTQLLMLGGFDKRKIFNDLGKDFKFLGMLYPARSYEKLKQTIGSIDFPSKELSF